MSKKTKDVLGVVDDENISCLVRECLKNRDVLKNPLSNKEVVSIVKRVTGQVLKSETQAIQRKHIEEKMETLNKKLEAKVKVRTAELIRSNMLLRQSMIERRQLEKEILEISEREKQRIGQEIHDELGQQLTGIAFMSKLLQQKLEDKSLPESEAAAKISSFVSDTVNYSRSLARGLHPVEMNSEGLMSALRELVCHTEDMFGADCEFVCEEDVLVEDNTAAIHLYRIAQEAVNNAVKHGKAQNISVGLAANNGRITMTIKNNGKDFPEVLESDKGMGLQIMDYRASVIGANLNINSGENGGTCVMCSLKNKI